MILLILIIGIPLLEIFLFIKIGAVIGAFNTIALILITAITGIIYARHQSFNAIRSGFAELVKNEVPIYEIISGASIAFAAILLSMMPWSSVFVVFAIISLLTIVFVPLLKSTPIVSKNEVEENLRDVLMDAIKDPTYIMLFLGFFSCGFQLAFITAHFPAFIAEASSPIIQGSLISLVCNSVASLGALSIALIGLFNIVCGLLFQF